MSETPNPEINVPKPGDAGLSTGERRSRPLVLSFIVLLLVFAAGQFYLNAPSRGQELSLDRVLRLTLEKKIDSVTLKQEDSRITGMGVIGPDGKPSSAKALKKPKTSPKSEKFWTSIPRSDATFNDIFKTFFSSGTRMTVEPQALKRWVRYFEMIILVLLVLNVLGLLRSRMRPGGVGAAISSRGQ